MGRQGARWLPGWLAAITAVLALAPAGAAARIDAGPQVVQHSLGAAPDPERSESPPWPVNVSATFFAASEDDPEETPARTAAADAAEAGCLAGDLAACTRLGLAYRFGRGRPIVRPLAEVLLRRACTGGEQAGCSGLAEMLRTRKRDDDISEANALDRAACVSGVAASCLALSDAIRDGTASEAEQGETLALFARACSLGASEGCPSPPPDPRALERGCKGGDGEACRTLAGLLVDESRSRRDRQRGLDLLDRLCRAGDPAACAAAAARWDAKGGTGPALAAEYRTLACRAGDHPTCAALGKAAFTRSPPDREAAVAFFALACKGELQQASCEAAADLREEPGLAASCAGGTPSACLALGLRLGRWNSILYDNERSIALLAGACLAGERAACRPAGEAMLAVLPIPEDRTARTRAVLSVLGGGCDAGDRASCELLADALYKGEEKGIAADPERAGTLYLAQCDGGREAACDALRAMGHPAAPLAVASDFMPPFLTPEEAEAEARFQRLGEVLADAAFNARRCRVGEAAFEGTSYADKVCANLARVTGGFPVARIEQAPWQALIWRPARLGRLAVPASQRVLCGGSVVATGWVLTAAHCLIDKPDAVNRFEIAKAGHRIRLGVINQRDEQEGVSYPILRAVRIDRFDPNGLLFDIALVQYDARAGTRGESRFSPKIIALDRRSPTERPVVERAPVFSFGWGRTDFRIADASPILQGVRLELRSARECAAITRTNKPGLMDSMFCAAGPQNQQTCNGDSGGPLITYGDRRGEPTLIGIVSGGWDCGTTREKWPSKYTRIGHPAVQAFLRENLPGFARGQAAR